MVYTKIKMSADEEKAVTSEKRPQGTSGVRIFSKSAGEPAKSAAYLSFTAPKSEKNNERGNKSEKAAENILEGASDMKGSYEYEDDFSCGPEIVITEKGDFQPDVKRSRHAVFPANTAVCVIALCLISFILGCSMTDSRLCRAMISLSAASYGYLPDGADIISLPPSAASKENAPTLYQRFSEEESESDKDAPFEFLGEDRGYIERAENTGSVSSLEIESSQDADIQTDGMSTGRIGSDGEVLYPIISRDLHASDVLALSNETKYSPDTYSLLQSTPAALRDVVIDPSEPLVLIIHTHGTECYTESPYDGFYSASEQVRSEDTDRNVVSIGEELAKVLGDFGIPAVHSTKMCDADSFIRAYSTSYKEASRYLEEYPSIKFVIDLHRDAISSADGTQTKPFTSINGEDSAQLMFVVGTDESGNNHPSWRDNLSLALTLQSEISEDYPTLFRRINLRSASFNQQLSSGYILLECGSFANTHEEAKNAARMFATGMAKALMKDRG